jgi:hypothetical protein
MAALIRLRDIKHADARVESLRQAGWDVHIIDGVPDAVDLDDIPEDFDFLWDRPLERHLPKRRITEGGDAE